MKPITVSVPDEVYTRARIKAAEKKTSVSALVKAYLVKLTEEETDFEYRLRLQNEVVNSIHQFSAKCRLTREDVHERDALR